MGIDSVDELQVQRSQEAIGDRKAFEMLSESERAEYVPAQIFDLKKNEPAFIFSRENLIAIKRYERAVHNLPSDDAVNANSAFAVLGLQSADIIMFFDSLRKHVRSWDSVEDACKEMGADLQVFAENLFAEGSVLIDSIKTMESWASAVAGEADADLLAPDTLIFKDLVETNLGTIMDDISGKLKAIRQVRRLIDEFGDEISDKLQPMAQRLLGRIGPDQHTDRLAEIEIRLAELEENIQKKLVEYNGLVGAAFYGLVFGPIGLLITGGIYGAQAETVRAEKNQMIQELQKLTEDRKNLVGDSEGLQEIRALVADMQFRLVDVKAAVKNLEDVWILLDSYAKDSFNKIKFVSTKLALQRFVERFERVISPWRNILGISREVSKIFNETLLEEQQG